MPRWASRITLEITDVRVQRLQEISEEDAAAEGMNPIRARVVGESFSYGPREEFRDGWDTINGRRAPWSSNPWVWALTFRRLPETREVRHG